MILPPRESFHGVVDPMSGTAVLHYSRVGRGSMLLGGQVVPGDPPDAVFTVTAPPWHLGGCPIVWDFAAAGPAGRGQIRLVVGREVQVAWDRTPFLNRVDYPLVEIVRVQDDGLLPDPETVIAPHRLIRPAYYWLEGEGEGEIPEFEVVLPEDPLVIHSTRTRNRFAGRGRATVTADQNGVTIAETRSQWEIEIRAPLDEPAAFAYEFQPPTQPFGYFVNIVCSKNVRIRHRLTIDQDGISQVFLQVARVPIPDVPPQGSALPASAYSFAREQPDDWTIGPKLREAITLFEVIVSVIPVVGVLYDVGQFAYAAATGRTFWGERLPQEQIAVLGLTALLPIAITAASAKPLLRGLIAQLARRKMAGLLDEALTAQVRQRADPILLEVIQHLPEAEQREVLITIERYFLGSIPFEALAKLIDPAIGRAYVAAAAQRDMLIVFTDDFRGFRNPVLAQGYQAYRSRGLTRNAQEWARSQASGRYRDELVKEIGPNVNQRISDAFGRRMRIINSEDLEVLYKHGGKIAAYRDMRVLAEGSGEIWNADHLFEKRFWNSPRTEGLFVEDEIEAILVPANRFVGAQLKEFVPELRLYVHTKKTQDLRRLIPNGKEDFFTAQQWWDAHVYVYRSNGMDDPTGLDDALFGRLREMFDDVAQNSGEPVVFRFNQVAEDFLPGSARWISKETAGLVTEP